MPLLELLAWLLIAGGLLVIAASIWLSFTIKDQVEIEPVLLPGKWSSWKLDNRPMLADPTSNIEKSDVELRRNRERDLAGAVPLSQPSST